MAGAKKRQCLINGDRPGVKNNNLSFTVAEMAVMRDFAKKRGTSLPIALVTLVIGAIDNAGADQD